MTKFMVKIAMNAGGRGDGEFLIQGIFSNLVLAAKILGRFDFFWSTFDHFRCDPASKINSPLSFPLIADVV